jgi:hypothetical protein
MADAERRLVPRVARAAVQAGVAAAVAAAAGTESMVGAVGGKVMGREGVEETALAVVAVVVAERAVGMAESVEG